ncbi:MAG: dihydroxy-acid dehydratase [Firmicutes bacterium]|nr:dihydroxy-acid dehydratase [Bacillota bacterium]
MSKEILNNKERIIQRASLRASGMDCGDIEKPIIGVLFSQECDKDALQRLQVGIFEGGGTPTLMGLPTVDTTHAFCANAELYGMPYRELVADTVETLMATSSLDGFVLVSREPMTLAGMCIGAVRVNMPCIFLNGGIQNAPTSLMQVALDYAKNKGNTLDMEQLAQTEHSASVGDNTLANNALGAVLEVLGLALPGGGLATKNTPAHGSIARKTGQTLIDLVKNDIRPKMLLTKASLSNAFAFLSALSLSTDCVTHLLALCIESGLDKVSLDSLKNLSEKTPTLLRPFDTTPLLVSAFAKSGGTMAVLQELSRIGVIDGSASTVMGPLQTWYDQSKLGADGVVSSSQNPLLPCGGLDVLYGNLATDGALYNRKEHLQKPAPQSYKAKVFDTLESATSALLLGKITAGDALVVRYQGPLGAPGMRSVSTLQHLMVGLGLSKSVALLTDGRATQNYDGLCICAISPEAALENATLCAVRDGDKITFDSCKSKLELDIVAKELHNRLKKTDSKDLVTTGFLGKYTLAVQQAHKGATTKIQGRKSKW